MGTQFSWLIIPRNQQTIIYKTDGTVTKIEVLIKYYQLSQTCIVISGSFNNEDIVLKIYRLKIRPFIAAIL